MRVLLIGAAIALAGSAAASPPFSAQLPRSSECSVTSRYSAARRDRPALFSRLGDLPPADAYKAVLRHNGRCEAPIIIRYNIGAVEEIMSDKR